MMPISCRQWAITSNTWNSRLTRGCTMWGWGSLKGSARWCGSVKAGDHVGKRIGCWAFGEAKVVDRAFPALPALWAFSAFRALRKIWLVFVLAAGIIQISNWVRCASDNVFKPYTYWQSRKFYVVKITFQVILGFICHKTAETAQLSVELQQIMLRKKFDGSPDRATNYVPPS